MVARGCHSSVPLRSHVSRGRDVSSRRYTRSLEQLPEELPIHGVSKSAVSERLVMGTARELAALTERKLAGLKLMGQS
jgi:hypothetical protein